MEEYIRNISLYLKESNCVLFLGPQFAVDSNLTKVHEIIKENLQKSRINKMIDYSHDNLFVLNRPKNLPNDRGTLINTLMDSYANVTPHEVYDKIVELPFSVIISCSPDTYLKNAFERKKIPHHFEYSFKGSGTLEFKDFENNTSNHVQEGARVKPLLYNIFGCIDDLQSLVITYEDLFSLMISIINEDTKQPEELKNRIKSAKAFLFLGFDLSKWYIPLLLHKVNSFRTELRGDEEDVLAVFSRDNSINPLSKKYIPHSINESKLSSEEIITSIYGSLDNRYKLKRQKEFIRKERIKAYKNLMAANEISEVLKHLEEEFKQNEIDENWDIINLKARHTELRKGIIDHTIHREEASVEANRIRKGIESLIDNLN